MKMLNVRRLIAFAAGVLFCCANASAQAIHTSLDHVVIAVRDLETAGRAYADLGLAVVPGGRHPEGMQNSAVSFSGGGYLELLSTCDPNLPGGKEIAELLKRGEGAIGAGLEIPSAENAARTLRASGVKVEGPTAGSIVLNGETKEPPRRWSTVEFADDIASRPLFLIQYVRDPERPPLPKPPHPNTASHLSALLIAVDDQDKATAAYSSIGMAREGEVRLPEFGAIARKIALERGSVLLLRSTDPAGPNARRLKEQGEGIVAVRIGVSDLNQCRKSVGSRNVSKDTQSVLVKPDNAAGIWLQFQSVRP